MQKILALLLALGLVLASAAPRAFAADEGKTEEPKAEEKVDDDTAKANEQLKLLDSDDAHQRAGAETKIRAMGAKALPALRAGKVENKEGNERLRVILMELSISESKINETDANAIMQLAKEEALAKRYSNAANGYKRAKELYNRLEDDADDKKDKTKKEEFDGKKDRAEKLRKKAERLAKGTEHKVSHWGPIPTIEKVEDDGDW